MCRILMARARSAFDARPHIQALAAIARDSKEYQGHGWGFAWLEGGQWRMYHDIRPVWEDDLDEFPHTTSLIVHARSAFRDEGIVVENNMPFGDERVAFAFNGELRGVRIKAEAPLSEMFGYIGDLRTITSGRGIFSMEFAHYAPCPSSVADKIIAEVRESREAA